MVLRRYFRILNTLLVFKTFVKPKTIFENVKFSNKFTLSQVRAKIQNLKKEGRIDITVPNSNCSVWFESAGDELFEEEEDDEQTPKSNQSKKFIGNGVVDFSD